MVVEAVRPLQLLALALQEVCELEVQELHLLDQEVQEQAILKVEREALMEQEELADIEMGIIVRVEQEQLEL